MQNSNFVQLTNFEMIILLETWFYFNLKVYKEEKKNKSKLGFEPPSPKISLATLASDPWIIQLKKLILINLQFRGLFFSPDYDS